MNLTYSFIIPVFNRPHEINELLDSFLDLEGDIGFEIIIIEDGSTKTCKTIIDKYIDLLNISYYFKPNSGPGDSRNFGMQKAKGNYFIILDSDVLLPANYLKDVDTFLKANFFHCYGGPDTAHESFSNLQKAINFVMTSFLTTGGIRGSQYELDDFQPRSFNMGLSKEAYTKSGGFGRIHPGEDPDLSMRLWELGYKTRFISKAFVYHKRRLSWKKFYKQVYKFGLVRAILNKWHPKSKSVTYWFPTVFCFGLLLSLLLLVIRFNWLFYTYCIYFIALFSSAIIQTKSLSIAIQTIIAVIIQFFGYGFGFIKSTIFIQLLRKKPEMCFPDLFFKVR